MSVRVLLRDRPHRSLALVTETYALIFRHSHAASESGNHGSTSSLSMPGSRPNIPPRCMVEFAPTGSVDLGGYRTVVTAKGTLGLITLNNDVFICVVTGSNEAASVRPGETVQKIYSVEFYCLNRSDYDHTHGEAANSPYPGQSFSSEDVDYLGGHDQSDSAAEHPFHALRKLLNGGNFYYSVDFDLTRRFQDRAEADEAVDIASLDEGLLWNSYMISPLLQFRSRLSNHEREALDHSRLLTSTIRGFVKTLTVPPSSAPLRRNASNYPSTLTLISRLSSRRAGTRFNSRGVDDDGNVANFVETETVFWSPTGVCFSYTQVRGSIPVFWESSSSLIPGQQKIQITRSPEATQPAFDKHFENLERTYGAVHVVNLLSALKPGEVDLTERYRLHINRSPLTQTAEGDTSDHSLLQETEFDFHERARAAGGYDGAKEIRPYLESSAESFVYFMTEEVKEKTKTQGEVKEMNRTIVIMQQNGVFRVNCLDCLDRTNLVQTIISQRALELFLSHRSESGTTDFWMRHSSLWADNGDALSKIYAGTGALKSSFTRHGKMSLAGAFADARKSATRLYVNNFADKGRQNTIDLLLGRLIGQTPVHLYDPINDYVVAELNRKAADYTSTQPIYLWVGTFNLNGKTTGISEDLSPWLHAHSNSFHLDYDVYAIGFQEIVELSPQQIMSTNPGHRAQWEAAVKTSLNSNPHRLNPDDEYVLLRSGQLVGAALLIFVKASILPQIKNVEGAIKKTGLSGIAGNKGAVAIRMDFSSTSVCFVTAHLAAGFANYEERNRDYRIINTGLRFQKDRDIEAHDAIIWLGDFNYRIGLSDERARKLVAANDLEALYENDQLNIQMVAGMTFPFYNENRITFPPTYKFDLGTDNYDTSEKGRIPAWTDRVLRKGSSLRQMDYGFAALRFSDHRPVFATFECAITIVDETRKSTILQKLYEKRKREVAEKSAAGSGMGGGGSDIDDNSSTDAEDLMGYESIAPDLPPASSDRKKWWLDDNKPVKSQVGPPREGLVLNSRREGNPWREGSNLESEWVEVERPSDTGSGTGTPKQKPEPPPPRGSRRMVVPPWEGERLARMASERLQGGAGRKRDTIQTMEMKDRPMPLPPTATDGTSEPLRIRTPSTATGTTTPLLSESPRSRTPSVASSSASGTIKKRPPPKPTKPSALMSSSSIPSVSPLPVPVKLDEATLPPLPARKDTASSIASSIRTTSDVTTSLRKSPPPLQSNLQPRRMGIQMVDNEESAGPPLPPRRTGMGMGVTDNGLMDRDDEAEEEDMYGDSEKKGQGLEGWKPLIPK